MEKYYARESRFWFSTQWYEHRVNVISARVSRRQDRRAFPEPYKSKNRRFRTHSSERRAKPVGLVYRFPSQLSYWLCAHTTGRRAKNGLSLRSIFSFINYCCKWMRRRISHNRPPPDRREGDSGTRAYCVGLTGSRGRTRHPNVLCLTYKGSW
jgi:hypothetical protein